jgi:hypothetical protein
MDAFAHHLLAAKKRPRSLRLGLAVKGMEATLSKPEYTESFKSSERKSRYLQSEALLRQYCRSVDLYNKYLASPGHSKNGGKGVRPSRPLRRRSASPRGPSGKPNLVSNAESPYSYYSRKCNLKNRPVCDPLQAATSSGVPVTTTSPPACPPSGPRSIT